MPWLVPEVSLRFPGVFVGASVQGLGRPGNKSMGGQLAHMAGFKLAGLFTCTFSLKKEVNVNTIDSRRKACISQTHRVPEAWECQDNRRPQYLRTSQGQKSYWYCNTMCAISAWAPTTSRHTGLIHVTSSLAHFSYCRCGFAFFTSYGNPVCMHDCRD